MPTFIIKIKDLYFEWSTISDSPATLGMTLDEFQDYYRAEYGRRGMRELPERLERTEKKGTSAFQDDSVEDTIFHNRAGDDEETLSADEIYEKYRGRK